MNIAINLKKLRESKEYTLEYLSSQLKLSFEELSSWEAGDSVPNMNQLISISKFYGVDVDKLLFKEVITHSEVGSNILDSNQVNLNERDISSKVKNRVPNIYKRQKMLIRIAGYLMYVNSALGFLVLLFFIRLIFSRISEALLFIPNWALFGVVLSILVGIGAFLIGNKLIDASRCSDSEFVIKIDKLLIWGFFLWIPVFTITPGSLLIISYFATDCEKYFSSHNDKRTL